MEFAKAKSAPLVTEMSFGETDVLHLQLDRDIITESFLVEMDAKGRHVFQTRMAGLRRDLQTKGILPKPDSVLVAEAKGSVKKRQGKAGTRARKRAAGVSPAPEVSDEERHRIAELVVQEFESMLPGEDQSIPLAQAQEMTYMAESLARVILWWDMEIKGKPAPITEPLMMTVGKGDKAKEITAPCCAAADSDCRHPSAFIRGFSYPLMSRFFQFCCFEAHESETKKKET